MYPRLLTTPFYTLHTFGVLLAAAYLAALWWLVRSGRRAGLDPDTLSSLGFWAIFGAILGAKVLMVVRSFPDYAANPGELFSRSFLTSAGDFYGGFIGGVVASIIFFKLNPSLSFWPLADLCAPAIALGQAIGRIGCLMAGDDYGRATTLPWAVTFTDPDAASVGGAPLGVPLHPVQAYESIVCLVLFAFLVWLSKRTDDQCRAGNQEGRVPGADEACRRRGDAGDPRRRDPRPGRGRGDPRRDRHDERRRDDRPARLVGADPPDRLGADPDFGQRGQASLSDGTQNAKNPAEAGFMFGCGGRI